MLSESPSRSLTSQIFALFRKRRYITSKRNASFQFHHLCLTILPLVPEHVMSCTSTSQGYIMARINSKNQDTEKAHADTADTVTRELFRIFI